MLMDGLNDQSLPSADARAGNHAAAAPLANAETSSSALGAALSALQDDQPKLCCICGLDVSQKKRSRDKAGRLWCAHCSDFNANAEKTTGLVPCPDCGRDTRPMLMVEQAGERVCQPCHQLFLEECELKQKYKTAVTTNPEIEIRWLIGRLARGLVGLAAASGLVTLYHFRLLYFRPYDWVPFVAFLDLFGVAAILVCVAIGVQYVRIAIRKRERQAQYDKTIRSAINHVLALDEESHSMGVSESPEMLRRRVGRAILRVEAGGGLGIPDAGKVIEALTKPGNAVDHGTGALVKFLLARRPGTSDTVGRNREIATISFLQLDLDTACTAVTAILLRLHHDRDAMSRHALICYRRGQLEDAKKIFKRVIHIAREKNSEPDLAAAYCNLGMLHMMLSEFDDASVRYSQALKLYTKLNREDGQADCLLNLGVVVFRQKKWAEVEEPLRKALAINRRRHRREGEAVCCSLLGMILLEKETPELSEARKMLDRAVGLNMELGRAGGVAAAYGNLGLVHAKREDFKSANDFLRKALDIYQRTSRPKMTTKIQGMLQTVAKLGAAKAARGR